MALGIAYQEELILKNNCIFFSCSVDRTNRLGLTALFYACEAQNLDIMKILLERGASTHLADRRSFTPLHFIAASARYLTPNSPNLAYVVADLLLSSGRTVNVNEGDADNTTALHIASETKDYELIEVLLHHGASIDAKDDYGNTPLHVTLQSSNHQGLSSADLRTLQLLLRRGAKVNEKNNDLKSPLHFACELGCPEAVKLLVQNGANTRDTCIPFNYNPEYSISFVRNEGFAPLTIAVAKRHHDVAEVLLRYPSDSDNKKIPSPLFFAVMNRDYEMTKILLYNGIRIERNYSNLDEPILHLATILRDQRIIDLLLFFGADYCRNKANRIFYQISSRGRVTDCIDGSRFLTFSPEESLELGKMLIRIAVYQQFRGKRQTNKSDYDLIESIDAFREFKLACEQELTRMRENVIWDHLTVYSILERDIEPLAKCLSNYQVIHHFAQFQGKMELDFPIYYEMLKLKFDLGMERKRHLDLAVELIDDLFKPTMMKLRVAGVPYVVIEKVLDFFTWADLKYLNVSVTEGQVEFET